MSKSPGPWLKLLKAVNVSEDAVGDCKVAERFLELNHWLHPANAALYIDCTDEVPCSWQEAWAAFQVLQTGALRARYAELGHDVAVAEWCNAQKRPMWANWGTDPVLDWRTVALWVAATTTDELLDGAWDGQQGAGLVPEVIRAARCAQVAALAQWLPDFVDPYSLEPLVGMALVGETASPWTWDAQPILTALLSEFGKLPEDAFLDEKGPELSPIAGLNARVVFRKKAAKSKGATVNASIKPMSAKEREQYRLSDLERRILGWTEAPDYTIEVHALPWLAMHGWSNVQGKHFAWPTRLMHHELLHATAPTKAGGSWGTVNHSIESFGAEVARYGARDFAHAEIVRAAWHHPETQRILSLAEREHDFRVEGGEMVPAPTAVARAASNPKRPPAELTEVIDLAADVLEREDLVTEGVDFASSVADQAKALLARFLEGESFTAAQARTCAGWRGGLNRWKRGATA